MFKSQTLVAWLIKQFLIKPKVFEEFQDKISLHSVQGFSIIVFIAMRPGFPLFIYLFFMFKCVKKLMSQSGVILDMPTLNKGRLCKNIIFEEPFWSDLQGFRDCLVDGIAESYRAVVAISSLVTWLKSHTLVVMGSNIIYKWPRPKPFMGLYSKGLVKVIVFLKLL